MKKILKGKFNLLHISFLLLTLYPLMKFNYSSIILMVFSIVCAYESIKNREFLFSKISLKIFTFTTLFFILLVVSAFYSTDINYAFKKIVQFIPLLIVPIVIIFFRPNIDGAMRTNALNLFLIVNFLYAGILIVMYLLNKDAIGLEGVNLNNLLLNYDKVQFVINDSLKGSFLEHVLFVHKPYFSMGFVISAIFALNESNKLFRINNLKSIVYVILFSFFSLLVIYTFSFPNVIALLACIVCFVLFKINKGELEIKTFIIPGIFLIGIFFSGVFYKSQDLDVKRGFNFIKSVIYQENIEGNDARIEIYRSFSSLVKKASAKELVFGFGVGDAQDVLYKESKERLRSKKTKNLLMFNEEFNNDYWFRHNIEIIPNQIISPNKTISAEILKEQNNESEGSHNLSKDVFLEKGSSHTFSVFAKKGTSHHVILRLGDLSERASFDLNKGVVKWKGDVLVNAEISKSINGWYRCSITVNAGGNVLAIIGISNKNGDYVYQGKGNDLHLWGAQIEKGNEHSDYVKNSTELIDFAITKRLNTHNNYLFFLISGGMLCLLSFICSLALLFYISFKNKNIFQLSFTIIIVLNLLTENILSRHWGLMFTSLMLLIFFTTNSKNEIKERA